MARSSQPDWMTILSQCRDRVLQSISPLLSGLSQPQPSLGIGAGGDPLKEIDLAAEKAIVDAFEEHGVSFTLVSEESGIREHGKRCDECYVTTDPVDGSTNLMRRIPFYATSIAISTEPTLRTVHSALVTDLFHNTTYTAQKGKGAHRDGARITPSQNSSLEEAVIGIDINTFKIDEIVPRLSVLVQRTKHLRHFGANALELCYVADGKSDAFVDIRGKLRTTDMAAAWLILKEAGGKITSPEGKQLDVRLDPKQKVDFVAAANERMHRTIVGLLDREKGKKC